MPLSHSHRVADKGRHDRPGKRIVAIPKLLTTTSALKWLKECRSLLLVDLARRDRHTHHYGTEKPGRLVLKNETPSRYLLAGNPTVVPLLSLKWFVTQKRLFPLILQKQRDG